MLKRIVLLVVLALSLPSAALAAEGSQGVIQGQLVNGTADGSSVGGIEVLLEPYVNNSQSDSVTAMTDDDGRFVFEALTTDASHVYHLSLWFQETEYFGEAISFAEGETLAETQIMVYDATATDENIVVTNSHTIVDVEVGGLRFTEVYALLNQGDRSYVGSVAVAEDAKATLAFPLPEGAIELQPSFHAAHTKTEPANTPTSAGTTTSVKAPTAHTAIAASAVPSP